MGNRSKQGRSGGTPMERSLEMLASSLAAVALRVTRLEGRGLSAGPDLRWDSERDGDDLYLVVRRVSTGNTQRVAGPL